MRRKRAAPDGYTLLQLDSEHLSALPYLYKSRGFETLKTFEPVAALFARRSSSRWERLRS